MRAVKIYTKTGDAGETGLLDGTRVLKSDVRVEACGAVDELGAWLGVVGAQGLDADLAGFVSRIQADLLAVGARLADPAHRIAERVPKTAIALADVRRLESWIDRLEADLPPLRRFILAGGCPAGAGLHCARTLCRRAERRVVALGPDAVEAELLAYLNRLSDLFFVMGRAANHRAGIREQEW